MMQYPESLSQIAKDSGIPSLHERMEGFLEANCRGMILVLDHHPTRHLQLQTLLAMLDSLLSWIQIVFEPSLLAKPRKE
jgi:hypothetical protein